MLNVQEMKIWKTVKITHNESELKKLTDSIVHEKMRRAGFDFDKRGQDAGSALMNVVDMLNCRLDTEQDSPETVDLVLVRGSDLGEGLWCGREYIEAAIKAGLKLCHRTVTGELFLQIHNDPSVRSFVMKNKGAQRWSDLYHIFIGEEWFWKAQWPSGNYKCVRCIGFQTDYEYN